MANVVKPDVKESAVRSRDPLRVRDMREMWELFEYLYNAGFGVRFDKRTDAEQQAAVAQGASLLFGEVLPVGVHRMLDDNHLAASKARVLYDLGSGPGKLALQALFCYHNIEKIVAVELAQSRFRSGADACRKLCATWKHFELKEVSPTHIEVYVDGPNRVRRQFQLRHDNLFNSLKYGVQEADIMVAETDVPEGTQPDLTVLLAQLKPGCRILLYHQMILLPGVKHETVAGRPGTAFERDTRVATVFHPVKSLAAAFPGPIARWIDLDATGRYLTSWSPENGHHFDTWRKADDLPAFVPAHALQANAPVVSPMASASAAPAAGPAAGASVAVSVSKPAAASSSVELKTPVAGRAQWLSVAYYTASPAAGRLDALLSAYKRLFFDWVSRQPEVVSYTIVRDDATHSFRSFTAFASLDAAQRMAKSPQFLAQAQALVAELKECPVPPKFESFPVYASTQ